MPVFALVTEGAPIAIVGAVLSTLKVDDGPVAAAELFAASVAVAEAIEIETVPSPEQEDSVTVRVVLPAPLTALEQDAVPVVLRLTSDPARVTALAPV